MLLKLSGYIFILIFLFSLPESLFFNVHRYFLDFIKKSRAIYAKLPFKTVNFAGNELLLYLSDYEGSLTKGIINQKNPLPRFKFYTGLIERLLEAQRLEGISFKKLIPELRLGIQKEMQFEKKVMKEILGGNLQFIIIVFTTWSFIFFSQALIAVKINNLIIFFILLLQVLGFILFNFLAKWLKKKQFANYSNAFREIYLFQSLVEVRMPIQTILQESQIASGVLVTHPRFHLLARRIIHSVERWRSTGLSPKEESIELTKEIWHQEEEDFLDFIKNLQILKFILMALLFLPAYFLYLASIFQFFMEQ